MNVARAMAAAVRAEATETVFALMGDGNMHLLAELAAAGARVVAARHEGAAMAMASGYAEVGGGVGVCSVTFGPGVTQAATPLIGAVRRGAPLVLFAGNLRKRAEAQYVDQRRILEDCGATVIDLDAVDDALDAVREAFYVARVRRTAVAVNVLGALPEQEYPWEWEYEPVPADLYRAQRPGPDPELMARTVELARTAERPVILAGRGAVESGARDELARLGERIGAIMATTLPAKGLFDAEPYAVGIAGAYASAVAESLFSEADLLLSFGAGLNQYTTEGGLTFPSAKLVAIDTAPAPVTRSTVPDLSIVADARRFAAELGERLGPADAAADGHGFRSGETLARLEAEQRTELEPVAADGGLDPRWVVRELEAALAGAAAETVIVLGVGHFQDFVIQYLRQPHGSRFVLTLYFGSIGEGLTTAIGVALARPGARVIVIDGDGSLMQNVQELDTVVRYGLDLGIVVLNDGGFGAERHKLAAKSVTEDGASAGSEIVAPAFGRLAEAFGMRGASVADAAELRPALESLVGGRGAALVDVRVSPAVVSEPFLKLYYGEANQAPHQVTSGGRVPAGLEE